MHRPGSFASGVVVVLRITLGSLLKIRGVCAALANALHRATERRFYHQPIIAELEA